MSHFLSSVKCGLLAGGLHHVFLQYPRQVSIFKTLSAMLIANLMFVIGQIWSWKEKPDFINYLKETLVFFVVYVYHLSSV